MGVGEVGEVGIPPVGEGTGESLSIKHGASPQTEQASPLSRILKGADFSASSQERKRRALISVQTRFVVSTYSA